MSSPHVASERPEGEEDSATVLEKKTSSEVVEDEGKHDRLVRRATTDDRMPLACPTCANCGPRDASANRFRSNVEIIEKPRQMIVLFATIGVAIYLVSWEGRAGLHHGGENPGLTHILRKVPPRGCARP